MKEKICFELGSIQANSFLYGMTPIYMQGNNENDRVASRESIPIHRTVLS